MRLALAAVATVAAALLQSSIVPFLNVGGAEPDLVLVLAIVWTMVAGLDGGLVSAFLGGLVIDALAMRPLGSTAFVLLIAVGVAAVVGRLVSRGRAVALVGTAFILGIASPLLELAVYGALRGPVSVADPLGAVLPDALYGTVLAALAAPLALGIYRRLGESERIDW